MVFSKIHCDYISTMVLHIPNVAVTFLWMRDKKNSVIILDSYQFDDNGLFHWHNTMK